MNKKILLSMIAIIATQTTVYSAVAHTSKVITPAITGLAGKFPAIVPATTTATSSSTPMIHLTTPQIETFTNNLAQVGARSYLPQIQMIWQQNPELIYNAQQAVKAADIEAQRNSFNLIIKEAKRLAAQPSGVFSTQDAMVHNPQLEKLINQDLTNNISNVETNLGEFYYSAQLLGKLPNKNSLYENVESPLTDARQAIKNILTDSKITPQQASNKLNTQISEFQKIRSAAKEINNNVKDKEVQQKISSIISDLEATENSLRQISGILQKTAPSQSKTASSIELKSWTESINNPSIQEISLQPSTAHEILEAVPMPKAIEPFFNTQIATINTHITPLATAMKKLLMVNIPNLDLLPHEQQVFDLEKIKITNNIKVFNNILNQIKKLSLDQNGLDTMKNLQGMLEVVVNNLLISLEAIKKEISTLPISQQSLLLSNLQTMVQEILAIFNNVETTQLMLTEFNAQKEALEKIKENADLAQFTVNSAKDVVTMKTTINSLQQILKSGDIVTTDKAPMGMLELFSSKLANYMQTTEKFKNITKLEDFRSLETELEPQLNELDSALNALQEKISWLPTSAAKNKALEEFAKLKLEYTIHKRSLKEFFKKATEIEEKHMFVVIQKNEIEIGYLVLVDKYNAIRLSITKNFPESQMSSSQREALAKFDNSLTEMKKDIDAIKNISTSFELDQLTNEFFKAGKLARFAKEPSALVHYKDSAIIPFDYKDSAIIPISEPSLAIPHGSDLATEVGKSYYKDSGLINYGPSALMVLPKYEETLNETLKFFGLKLVIGLTATGTVTWLARSTQKDDTTKATALKEFEEKSNELLEKIKKLDQVQDDKLNAAIKDLDFNIKLLNLKGFKEAAIVFLEKIKAIIRRFITEPIDNTRLKILKRWNGYIDEVQEELEEYMNQPETTQRSSDSIVQKIKDILNPWLPNKGKSV